MMQAHRVTRSVVHAMHNLKLQSVLQTVEQEKHKRTYAELHPDDEGVLVEVSCAASVHAHCEHSHAVAGDSRDCQGRDVCGKSPPALVAGNAHEETSRQNVDNVLVADLSA